MLRHVSIPFRNHSQFLCRTFSFVALNLCGLSLAHAGALTFVMGGASAQYAALFNALKQVGKLTDAVNTLGTLRGSTVGPDLGEVILSRDTPNGTVAFPVWFLRGPDGVWRVESM